MVCVFFVRIWWMLPLSLNGERASRLDAILESRTDFKVQEFRLVPKIYIFFYNIRSSAKLNETKINNEQSKSVLMN